MSHVAIFFAAAVFTTVLFSIIATVVAPADSREDDRRR